MTALVILPGLDGTTALLEAFCLRIRQSGLSARAIGYPPDRVMGYPELESLVRVRLPASEPFALLGESFSGPLAIRIAAEPPPNLVGLVLSTTFARSPVPVLAPLTRLTRFAPARPPMPLLSWALLGPWATQPLRSALRSALHTAVPAVLRARAAAAIGVDVSANLPSVRIPTMHLVASHDRLLGRAAARMIAHGIPHSRTVTVAGPHLLLQTAIEPCALEVADFVSSLAADTLPAIRSKRP